MFFGLFVMLFTLYYVFKDGEAAMRDVQNIHPMIRQTRIFKKFNELTFTTFYAGFVVAAVQGLLAGIAFAVLGSANVTLMAGARIYYAMSVDGLAPAVLGRTNRGGAPVGALWVGGVWAALLSVVGQVGELVNWATLAILLLSSLAVASLFVLRRREGHAAPFLCPGYPITPALYLAASLGIAVSNALHDARHALAGLAILALAFPAFALTRWLRAR